MALITKDDVKTRLDQLDDSHDTLLEAICEEVEDTITLYLGFSFEGTTTGTKTVYGSGTRYLTLPPHELGSVTLVTAEGSTSAITGYTEDEDGTLTFTGTTWGCSGWYQGQRYTVTGDFGYGEWPDSLKRVAVEMAVNAFRERDKGHFSDVVGVEGAGGDVAVGYKGAWLKSHKAVMDLIIRKYRGLQIA